ncbi:peptidoglycan editing factor PgeF [Sphingomonas rhizophila]|uniref:Purine nucleoside phosphorylase n=1 Tax=Sphingomonas rhizophila TaxID=2071607 RepID=A0A7G9SEJ6_9SPHN|nr:peptidoglycan editing factor PgeF [Sphingomonas rhizophila]QNN66271.1 peptidoglycan editing factor PgeF [Sphingomonas rhizophila]
MGRRGGVSAGGDLNCGLGSNDDPALVAENRRRAAGAVMPEAPLVGVYQIHSADCVAVEAPWGDADRPRADALVTDRPGVLLSILTADCAPVLLADAEAGVVGAAHAGWRGAIGGVTDATIAAMLRLGARIDHIAAAVGPCIAQRSYEVDQDFLERFLDDDAGNDRFFAGGPGDRPHFDLEAYVVARLAAAGVRQVEALGLDTYHVEDRFFSFRRATHRGEADYGRQVSIIGLPTAQQNR